jgi:uncharacterized membrane protein YgdD (TMEM256/DUF423 family)
VAIHALQVAGGRLAREAFPPSSDVVVMVPRFWIVFAGLSGAIAVGCGAYGAHGLAKSIDAAMTGPVAQYVEMPPGVDESAARQHEIAHRIENWNSAARYQLAHACALFGVALAAAQWPKRCWNIAGALFLLGTAMFSGGLYAMAFVTVKGLGYVVMSGGICYIAGWIAVAAAGITCCPNKA